MKKLLAILLAIVLLAGMGVPALAAQLAYADAYEQENDVGYEHDTRPDWWVNFFDNIVPRLGELASYAAAIAGIAGLFTVLMRGLQFFFGADGNVWLYSAISVAIIVVIAVIIAIVLQR